MDGELHAILDVESDHPIARARRFAGLKPEGYVTLEVQAERSRRWTSRTLLTATVLLLVFNAHALESWASTLAPNWTTLTIRQLAEVWAGRMAAGGFDEPRADLRASWEGARKLTWRQVAGTHVELVRPARKQP
jgi:hypothetical protein